MPRKDPELEEAQPESGSTPEPTHPRRAEVPDIKSTGRSALLSPARHLLSSAQFQCIARYHQISKADQGPSRLEARQPVRLGRLVLD